MNTPGCFAECALNSQGRALLAEQACTHKHKPSDKCCHAEKKRKIAQDCRHGEASPLRTCAETACHAKTFSSAQHSTLELTICLVHDICLVHGITLKCD